MVDITLKDRIKETSNSTGTGNFQLDGAATGYSAFIDYVPMSGAVFYCIRDNENYEVGSGQFILDGSNYALTRFPYQSTNSDNKVNFAAGVKEVFVTYPGKYSVVSALPSDAQPAKSGIPFWNNSYTLNYDADFIWDETRGRMGIRQSDPLYTLDIGGTTVQSHIRVSGMIVGDSGIMFSGVAATGGRQTEPFLRNVIDTNTGLDTVLSLSGIVGERLQLEPQAPMLFFAGPSGTCGCSEDYPTFRAMRIDDVPDLSTLYTSQYNPASPGKIAFYYSSGVIQYDDYLHWNKTLNRLGVNKTSPQYTLDVDGDVGVSGTITGSGNWMTSGNLTVDGTATVNGVSTLNSAIVQTTLAVTGASTFTGAVNANGLNTFAGTNIFTGDSYHTGSVTTSGALNASGTVTTAVYGFTDPDHVRIGNNAGNGISNPVDIVTIGNQAATNSVDMMSGVFLGSNVASSSYQNYNSIYIGHQAGQYAKDNNTQILIGDGAGQSTSGNIHNVFIGREAGTGCKTTVNTVGIGVHVGTNASGQHNVWIGNHAGDTFYGTENVCIGMHAGRGASGVVDNVFIGREAGTGIRNSSNSVAIGLNTGHEASGNRCIWVGHSAGLSSSGNNNIFIGHGAGISASGTSNIEIFATGTSLLKYNTTANFTRKIHIGQTIVGDTLNQKIAIGDVDATGYFNPEGTLVVYPKMASDVPFIVAKKNTSTADQTQWRNPNSGVQIGIDKDFQLFTNSGVDTGSERTIVHKSGVLVLPRYTTVAAATGDIPIEATGAVAFVDDTVKSFLISDGTAWYSGILGNVV